MIRKKIIEFFSFITMAIPIILIVVSIILIGVGISYICLNDIKKLFFISGVVVAFCTPIFSILYKSKRTKKADINQNYVYHLLNENKLKAILLDNKNKRSGYVNINLKRSKNIFHNYSTLGKPACYFHSSLKGFSYFYNHFLKNKSLDYMIGIQTANFDEEYLRTRKIDNCLMYMNDYIGQAKILNCNKFKFIKINKAKKYIVLLVIDFIYTSLLGGYIVGVFFIGYWKLLFYSPEFVLIGLIVICIIKLRKKLVRIIL